MIVNVLRAVVLVATMALPLAAAQTPGWEREDWPGQGRADKTAPTVPSGLSASAVPAAQIDLAWNASTDNVGVTGYRVLRDGVHVATTSATTYADSGLVYSTTYTYSVAAFDAAGNASAASDAASATTLPPPDVVAPS